MVVPKNQLVPLCSPRCFHSAGAHLVLYDQDDHATTIVENDCFVTVHYLWGDFNAGMREQRYYTSSYPLYPTGTIC